MVESVFVLNVSNSVTSNTANYPKVLDNRSTVFTYSMATDLGGGGDSCKIKSVENIYRSKYPDSRSQIIEEKNLICRYLFKKNQDLIISIRIIRNIYQQF